MKHKISKKLLFALAGFVLAIVGVDQLTKALVVAGIPFGEEVPLIPGVIHLTYVRNSGAAFSMLSGMQWLFLVLVAVFLVVLILMIRKGILYRKTELWCMAAITGGALGNAIDRAVSGTVVDMLEPEFMQFAVFNVADCFITCGAILFVIYLLFSSGKGKKETQEDAEKHEPAEEEDSHAAEG